MEAIIPTESGMLILRTEIPEEANTEALAKDLDMTDELREAAVVRMVSYQQRTKNLYNRRVRQCAFQAGDLVLRRFFEYMTNPTADKFQPNWEGPYMIAIVGLARSYALDKLDRMLVPRMWNAMHLKRYYQYKFFKGIRFPLEHFLPILGILTIKFSVKVLSIKFPLKYFLLIVPLSKDQTYCSKLVDTFKIPNLWL